MKHDQRLLDLYLDGGLDSDRRIEISDHLIGCPTCADYVASRASLRTAVQNRLRSVQPPAHLIASIREELASASAPRPPAVRRPFRPLPVFPAAALLILLAFGAVLIFQAIDRQTSPALDLTAELAAAHVSFAHDDSLLEVTGDQATIQSWLQQRVEFRSSVLEVPGYELHGGRIVTFDGQPATMLVYENEPSQEYISILTFAKPFGDFADIEPAGPFRVGAIGEIAVAVWPDGGVYHALVGDITRADVIRLASLVSVEPT